MRNEVGGPLVDLRMIDFAHVFQAEEGRLDSNYIYGLENLIHAFKSLGNQSEVFLGDHDSLLESQIGMTHRKNQSETAD